MAQGLAHPETLASQALNRRGSNLQVSRSGLARHPPHLRRSSERGHRARSTLRCRSGSVILTGSLSMINVITTTEASGEVRSTEFQMSLSDGTELFYRAWFPREPTRKALVIFHRGHEHSGRLEDVVRDLRLRDV